MVGWMNSADSNSSSSSNGENTKNNRKSSKIENFVSFPVDEYLDLSPFMDKSSNELNTKYSLQSVIVHSGAISSGHYVSYIKKDNKWFKCDDKFVSYTESSDVKKLKAYLLFYQQIQE